MVLLMMTLQSALVLVFYLISCTAIRPHSLVSLPEKWQQKCVQSAKQTWHPPTFHEFLKSFTQKPEWLASFLQVWEGMWPILKPSKRQGFRTCTRSRNNFFKANHSSPEVNTVWSPQHGPLNRPWKNVARFFEWFNWHELPRHSPSLSCEIGHLCPDVCQALIKQTSTYLNDPEYSWMLSSHINATNYLNRRLVTSFYRRKVRRCYN